jgi:hypothetical protein
MIMENPNVESSSQDQTSATEQPNFSKNNFTIFVNDLKDEFKDGMQEFYMLGNAFKNFFANIGKWFQNLFSKKTIEERQLKISKKILDQNERLEKKLMKIEEDLAKTSMLATEIKDDTEKIKLDVDLVVKILDYQMELVENLEDYMKDNLGSDWLQIKNCWRDYKEGEISRGEFAKRALKKLGKNFLSIFVNTVS